MDEVVIPLSKTKGVLAIVGAVAMLTASLFAWSIADQYANDFEIRCVAEAGIALSAAVAIYCCFKLFDRRPGLVIDAEGLVDNSSAVAVGRISWDDIVGVTVHSIAHQRFLTIAVRDPQKYVARGGALKRILHGANLKLTGSPINIASTALRIRFDTLERLVTEAVRDRARSRA